MTVVGVPAKENIKAKYYSVQLAVKHSGVLWFIMHHNGSRLFEMQLSEMQKIFRDVFFFRRAPRLYYMGWLSKCLVMMWEL